MTRAETLIRSYLRSTRFSYVFTATSIYESVPGISKQAAADACARLSALGIIEVHFRRDCGAGETVPVYRVVDLNA